MPKVAKELSALDVKRLRHPGHGHNTTVAVGGVAGLLLQMTPSGGRSWLLRSTVGEVRRHIGLGGYPDVSLAQARERARETKEQIWHGVDPLEQKRQAKAALATAQKRGMTFSEAMKKYLAAKLDEFRNEKHRKQWQATLDTYALPAIGDMLVSDIAVQDLQRTLEPIWATKTETASRLRGRIESVLAWATVSGHRSGDNPARWNGNLDAILAKPSKVSKGKNHPALSLDDVAAWFADLKGRAGMATRALEFVTLTAARSGEVRGMEWREVDLARRMWTIPAGRMKARREHRVPLTDAAIRLLNELPRMAQSDLVFPAARAGELSDMSLSATMRRIHEARLQKGLPGYLDSHSKRPGVPHGLRSSFRDWAAERTEFPREMAEIALAHNVGSEVERSYRRSDMVERRRAMMDAWARFLHGEAAPKMVPIDGARV